jgi:hypothetical protein
MTSGRNEWQLYGIDGRAMIIYSNFWDAIMGTFVDRERDRA